MPVLLHPDQPLTLPALAGLLRGGEPVRLAAEASPAAPVFDEAADLLPAYAAGTGPTLPSPLLRRMLLLLAHRLGRRSAGLAPARRLLDFFNRDVWPVVPEQGALGLRGNQVPLAHLSLPLLGRGEVSYQGYTLAAADVLGLFGWEPLALPAPEAARLLGGREFVLAHATEALARAAHLLPATALTAGLAAVAYGATASPEAAEAGFGGMEGVLAAARQALAQAEAAVEAALNAPDEQEPLASDEPGRLRPNRHPPLQLAGLARAVALAAGLAARRTAGLVAGGPGLPRYLAATAGQPGLRALPDVAASLASHNQQLVFLVAAAESAELPTRPLSTGASGAAELLRLLGNAELLLGLELLAATQALDLRPAARPRPAQRALAAAFRARITFVVPGQMLAPDLEQAARFVREYDWA